MKFFGIIISLSLINLNIFIAINLKNCEKKFDDKQKIKNKNNNNNNTTNETESDCLVKNFNFN